VNLRLLLTTVCVAAPLAAQTNSATPPASERSAAGAYTELQAARGDTVYRAVCAACHTTSYHTDEQFRFNWFGRTVYDLFKTLKTTMPEDNPGGLTDDEYTRVIAYILKLNGFGAGTDSLAADSTAMRRIRMSQPADSTAKAARDTVKLSRDTVKLSRDTVKLYRR
jgi:mono/diheme cytochrome c family protein